MKITHLGKELDTTVEHELFPTEHLGFTIDVVYVPNSLFVNETFNNITGFHYLYDKSDRVAFESDIHGTGMTRGAKYIESLVITHATERAEEF